MGINPCFNYRTLQKWHIDFSINGGFSSRCKFKNNSITVLFKILLESNRLIDTVFTSHISDLTIKMVQGYLSGKLVEDIGVVEGDAKGGIFYGEAYIIVKKM